MSVVVDQLRAGASQAFAGQPVRFAYLFGSHAIEKARADSDVDIAVVLDDSVEPEQYLNMQLELARRLATATALGNIDVLVWNNAPLPLQGRIVDTRCVIYSVDEPGRVQMESRIARLYGDYQISFRGLERELLAHIAVGRR